MKVCELISVLHMPYACTHTPSHKLKALVCDILPSTTAIFIYAISPRKLQANEIFFVGAQTVVVCSKQLGLYIGRFITDHVASASSSKPKSFESRRNSFNLPRLDVFHVYVCAWALGCFHSLTSTQTFWRVLTVSADSCAEIKIECPFSGTTKSGRVWRKVQESDARSVTRTLTDKHAVILCSL